MRKTILGGLLLAVLVSPFQSCDTFEAVQESSSNLNLDAQFSIMPASASGVRPLSNREYKQSLNYLIGENSDVADQSLDEDSFSPFDNFVEEMSISEARIKNYETISRQVVTRFLADSARVQRYLPCVPTGANDTTCFRRIVESVGMKAFRRPLTSAERTRFENSITTFAQRSNQYRDGLEVFLNVVLQHPNFLYRWEVGEEDSSGTYRLTNYELASRLSFTLFGQTPDIELLEEAGRGDLNDPELYKAIIDRMLQDPRHLDHIDFFHSAWLGYHGFHGTSTLQVAMRAETKALLKRVIIDENQPWRNVLLSNETFVTRELATHYNIPQPTNPNGDWVRYPAGNRAGLLSHASFLAVGAKFGDTSPVQRGYNIRKSLLCEQIPPPPPGINVDEPPKAPITSPCKLPNHEGTTLRAGTACIGCHSRMDRIGFGLEMFSPFGQLRTTEPNLPECTIAGQGEVVGYNRTFSGPAQLAQIIVETGRAEMCLVERWVQLTNGRKSEDNQYDIVNKYKTQIARTGRFEDLIKAFVMSQDFRLRKNLEK